MRLNESTKLAFELGPPQPEGGARAVGLLVPYERGHVEKYNAWMKDPFLQEMTASEPLSLEEEFGMQRSWREDEDKLAFIVHLLDGAFGAPCALSSNGELSGVDDAQLARGAGMVGDVNVFLRSDDDGTRVGEVEVMLAEAGARGRGLGKKAAALMLLYTNARLGVRHFEAKIKRSNHGSVALFHKLGFVKVSECEAFDEATLRLELQGGDGDGGEDQARHVLADAVGRWFELPFCAAGSGQDAEQP